MMEEMLNSKYIKYSTPELRNLIIKNNEQSDEVAFYLIRYRMLPEFRSIYVQYNSLPDELGDVLNDFWLYLRNGKTGKNTEPYKGLHGIMSSLAFSRWIKRTFRNFIFDRNSKIVRQKTADAEYNVQDENDVEFREKQITDFSLIIAWLHQLSTPDQRFILYRHLMQNICHNDLIDNKKIAQALGLTYGNYRTRNSRLSDRIRELTSRIEKGEHPELDIAHKNLAKQIDENFGQLHTILKALYEKNLPATTHWVTIQALRKQDLEERERAAQQNSESYGETGARFSLKDVDRTTKYSIGGSYGLDNDDDQPRFSFELDPSLAQEKRVDQLTKNRQTTIIDFSDLSPRKIALRRFKESI